MEDQSHPVSMMIIRDDSGINSISELAHKRIGILPTRAYEVWLRSILSKNNVDPNDVIIQQIPPALQPQALMTGSVQALFTNDPGATNTLSHQGAKLLVKGAIVPQYTYEPFYFGSFNIRKDWAAKNPDTVVKIAQALNDAIDIINSDQAYAKRLMPKFVDSKLELISDRYPDSLYWKTDKVANADLKRIYDYDISTNIISTPLSLDGSQYR
jgi:ABC-type nitrate/sulfonate/bicarbonate transport system substrate-binding protein